MLVWMIEDPTAGILTEWDGETPTFSWSKPRGHESMVMFMTPAKAVERLTQIWKVRNGRYRDAFVRTWRWRDR